MEIVLIVIGGLLLGGVGYLIFQPTGGGNDLQREEEFRRMMEDRTRLNLELQHQNEQLGKLQAQMQGEKSAKDKLSGQGKQLFAEITELKEKNRVLQIHNEELLKKVAGFEKEQDQRNEDQHKRINDLEAAKKTFEEEKLRIRREDEERVKIEEDERNRVWNEHEMGVVSSLREICQRPEIGFNFFDNVNLPESFDGGLKPDFLVELFPEQYIIFDAKFSENKISTYFNAQVPKTVQKIKKSKSVSQIYSTVFFVVPADLLAKSKKSFAYHEGYSFFMISSDSLAPILQAFKKITEYEFADQLNPQDRENIVNVLSGYESFIRNQNAANVLIAEKAVEVINAKEVLSEELNLEIDLKRKNIKPLKLKDSEMKKMTQSLEEQGKKRQQLTSPQPKISKEDLEQMQEQLFV